MCPYFELFLTTRSEWRWNFLSSVCVHGSETGECRLRAALAICTGGPCCRPSHPSVVHLALKPVPADGARPRRRGRTCGRRRQQEARRPRRLDRGGRVTARRRRDQRVRPRVGALPRALKFRRVRIDDPLEQLKRSRRRPGRRVERDRNVCVGDGARRCRDRWASGRTLALRHGHVTRAGRTRAAKPVRSRTRLARYGGPRVA